MCLCACVLVCKCVCEFVSLVLWGWVLGPVGMLLSIPLTIMIKIALENQPDTRWIGIMLGGAIDKESVSQEQS